MKLKAATGPTPRIAMKRWQKLVAGNEPHHQVVQLAIFCL
jgi:hypothetical protein